MAGNGGGKRTLELVGQHADVRFYGERASALGGPLLVLGSGDGRIAWALAEGGAQVLAVDPSAVMVATAEQRRALAPPEASSRLKLLCGDLRALRLQERFPVVLAPQNALGLMATYEDLDALLATVRHHLQRGGTFLFDMLNPLTGRGTERDGDARPNEPLPPSRPVFVPHLRERRRPPSGPAEGGIRRLRLRQFTTAEVDQALARAGLVALERYGDFQGRAFLPDDALQVALAQREDDG